MKLCFDFHALLDASFGYITGKDAMSAMKWSASFQVDDCLFDFIETFPSLDEFSSRYLSLLVTFLGCLRDYEEVLCILLLFLLED
jgi:hypothetical protein